MSELEEILKGENEHYLRVRVTTPHWRITTVQITDIDGNKTQTQKIVPKENI